MRATITEQDGNNTPDDQHQGEGGGDHQLWGGTECPLARRVGEGQFQHESSDEGRTG
jgi:hypothetical protein